MIPSCSRTRRRSESVGGLMPGRARSSSEKRRAPSERSWTMIAVHFEPMMSAVHATLQFASWTGLMVRTIRLYSARRTVPPRGAPAACAPLGEAGYGPQPKPPFAAASASAAMAANARRSMVSLLPLTIGNQHRPTDGPDLQGLTPVRRSVTMGSDELRRQRIHRRASAPPPARARAVTAGHRLAGRLVHLHLADRVRSASAVGQGAPHDRREARRLGRFPP